MEHSSQGKRWVFDELVEDRSADIQGLVAYALYKANKADIAKTKREQGLSEEEIVAEVSTFHQNAVNSRSMLEGYRERAGILLQELSEAIEEEVREEYEHQVASVEKKRTEDRRRQADELSRLKGQQKKEIDKERKKAVTEFVAKVKQTPCEKALPRVVKWQWNGFSGVFAAIIFAVIVGGVIYQGMPEDKKGAFISSVIAELVGENSSY
ncbi:hypothetical protein K1Y77_16195 [Halomonas qaidamensis]|uniref:Uncharacterized protein n=1 Tax=Halomonas qaidamensis TaxID=2866211 RepID=A0ABY6JP87_9GAMM|nr:hypothetical protein [Halomonas qaidamensis]UYV18963.1 hypothetical protein K1Y77_16195 [Halomonas qaidamensis]